jgi:hypothetical protein
MRQREQMRAPEQRSARAPLTQRWREWLRRRRTTRNQQLLEAGRLLLDDPQADRDPQPPVTDVYSWLGHRDLR